VQRRGTFVIDIRALAYVVLDTTDLDAWRTLGRDVLGMCPVEADSSLAFKMDERALRIIVRQSDIDRYHTTAWEVSGDRAFDEAIECLAKTGIAVEIGSDAEAEARKVSRLIRFADPSGNHQELVCGFKTDFTRFQSPRGVSRFVTGDLGMGHTVLPAPDFARTYTFYTDVMGFGLADVLVHRPPAGAPQRIYFLHCNNGRHHSLALFEGDVPAGCVHLMVEVETMDEVGRCFDRMKAAGVKLMCTLGKHVNDEMTSFYLATPGGFAIEYGYGGKVIDWKRHVAFESTAVSLWGHDFSVGFG
jgi:3,4-dihydroxy-9,10-secoandrosta-1,3,5(10)-triene-9,17-dione 4,5-dioxygenase